MNLETAARSQESQTVTLLRELVQQPSVAGNDEAILTCLDLIAASIGHLAREVVRPECDGLPALIARFGNASLERCVTFSGHIDVVPAEGSWSTPPFSFTIEGNSVIGRGVTDMKAGVAAFSGAIRALATANLLHRCAIELVITADEEVGSKRGTRRLLSEGMIHGAAVVCGEPTALDVYLGNRGVAWYEIEVKGHGGHAGQLQALDSPVGPATDLIRALSARTFERVDDRFDPPTPSLAVTRIDAGASKRALNVVPDTVAIGIDRRFLPGESIDSETRFIQQMIAEHVRSPFEASLQILNYFPPCETSADHPISLAAVSAAHACGRSGKLGMDRAANDSSWFVEAGIPAILVGPGDPEQAHVTNETLDLADLYDAIRLYAELALRFSQGTR